jgi:hypothetical protein
MDPSLIRDAVFIAHEDMLKDPIFEILAFLY